MTDVRQRLRELVEEAKSVHAKERGLTVQSVILVARLERMNAAVNFNMSKEDFARCIGLSINTYWKRAQAGRVIAFFPKALEMLKAGETKASHLVLIASKVTQANQHLLLDGIKGKSRREVEELVAKVNMDGTIKEGEVELEVRFKLKASEMALLDRAREVLSAGGHVPSMSEVMVKALGELLERRDPMRRAERALARQTAKTPAARQEVGCQSDPTPAEGLREVAATRVAVPAARQEAKAHRPAISAGVRHQVWLRDGGQCTWKDHAGRRCPERAMLEIDHLRMYCRGGSDELENLALVCRYHNRCRAAGELGLGFMDRWRVPSAYRTSWHQVDGGTPDEDRVVQVGTAFDASAGR